MQDHQQFIVPALGLVNLLAAVVLGVGLVYQVLLGLLGIAAIGTYFAPQAVQVESRMVIAAVGLLILLLITSIAFWVTLMAFGAIAALQWPNRNALQRSPATLEWLTTVWAKRKRAPSGPPGAPASDAAPSPEPPPASAALPGFVRGNVAGMGGMIVGVLLLVATFLSWFGFIISVFGEWVVGTSFTLLGVARELEEPALYGFFFVLVGLSMVAVATVILPRFVVAIVAFLGVMVTAVSYLYMMGLVDAANLRGVSASATVIPSGGALLAFFGYGALLVLQLIPGFNGRRSTPPQT